MKEKETKDLAYSVMRIVAPIISLFACAIFAWIPMLGWNIGVRAVWPDLPSINYWEAIWLSAALSYLKTSIVKV